MNLQGQKTLSEEKSHSVYSMQFGWEQQFAWSQSDPDPTAAKNTTYST